MKATSIKQIKFNRGQVTDLLSERVDMGLQNACGTLYDNMYINRYGQLQNTPNPIVVCNQTLSAAERVVCMFDTGEDKVFPVVINTATPGSFVLKVYPALSKTNQYQATDFSSAIASQTVAIARVEKVMQFGYNLLFYGQGTKPWLANIVPQNNSWDNITLTVKPTYFDGAFSKIFIRGLNTGTPTGFTVPTSGSYTIPGQAGVTTQNTVKVYRNGAGSNFTNSLIGQMLDCKANGGALQVISIVDNDNLIATVLSPLLNSDDDPTRIKIPFDNEQTKWIFGYENPYGDTASPSGTASYPDSAIFVNQRLVFGGNDYHGNLISASRVGVINDFEPETSTESDAFTTAISSKDFCRIVDFTVSNSELRICCTNGEYAMSLDSLTPTASLKGFDLRSEIGTKKGTAVCDCGGIVCSVSQYGDSIYGTQFSLLRDRYQPISLTSQTSNIVYNCGSLVYLTNRKNNEGNCLVGRNGDYSMFGLGVDINAGLIGAWKIKPFGGRGILGTTDVFMTHLFAVGDSLWAQCATSYSQYSFNNRFLIRFTFGEMFAFPVWYRYYAPGSIIPPTELHPNKMVIMSIFYYLMQSVSTMVFRAFYYNKATKEYEFITPTGYTNNNDGTYTVNFADDIDQKNLVCAGFVRQSDWRSVEIGMGMATRELNKRIVKLEGVIEPTQITGQGRFRGLVLTHEQAKKFITLTRSKDVQTMDVDNLSNTSYTENADLVWRRAFDNPDRELHYGVSFVAPFLVKSLTATVEYDEIQ